MLWTEIEIKAPAETEEILTSILYELGATGLMIEDPKEIDKMERTEYDWDFVDESLINKDIDGIIVKVYFSEDENAEEKIQEIRQAIDESEFLDGEKHILSSSEVKDSDWEDNWKSHFNTMRIGDHIVVKPSWENPDLKDGDILIELDPGMAFGTGTHETTFMCGEALEEYQKPSDTVYDIGCGSGILSIISAKLGAGKVVGVDLDPLAVKVSNENIVDNKVDHVVEIIEGDLLEVVKGKANIIVANIIAEIIASMVPDLKAYLENDGIFITSGIIVEKAEIVKSALLENGFEILEIKEKNGWTCIVAKLK